MRQRAIVTAVMLGIPAVVAAAAGAAGCDVALGINKDYHPLGAGGGAEPPSCGALLPTCGPNADESCCQTEIVHGGTYNRGNDALHPATVSDFYLDRFEITVGRFRAYVNAYPGSKPKGGAGAHPRIDGSGWDPAWDSSLPGDAKSLKAAVNCDGSYATWTDLPMGNENLPMNCLTWYDAFAFCAWDGGRLPTEAEWNYVAAGGAEQRDYPWGSEALDNAHAIFSCRGDMVDGCSFADILAVGSKSTIGDSLFHQADIAGSVREWVLDGYAAYPDGIDCKNCANLTDTSSRVARGGSWSGIESGLLSSSRDEYIPSSRSYGTGSRCARTP